MAKFSGSSATTARPSHPIRTTGAEKPTFEYGRGFLRDPRSELFLLAVTNMVGENTFYETAAERDNRFVALIHRVLEEPDGADWMRRFIPWLRREGFMRSAPIVMAVEYARAGAPHAADVIASACKRGDEPAELLGYYWATNNGRRTIAASIKRGLAKAAGEIYTERSFLRYSGSYASILPADVVDMTMPTPKDERQSALFRYMLDSRHRRVDEHWNDYGHYLPLITLDRNLQAMPAEQRRAFLRNTDDPEIFSKAGWSWERLSGWLPDGMDAEAWETMIPSMGYMALLRNLRNFDAAGISDEAVALVDKRLTDPEEVARSMQFPFRFLSAYKATPSGNWTRPLSKALDLSCANIPILAGNTLVLVDVSASMDGFLSAKSTVPRFEVGALFGTALARKAMVGQDPNRADLVCFGAHSDQVQMHHTGSVLRGIDLVKALHQSGRLGHSTYIWDAASKWYKDHDRIVIFTDEQGHDDMAPGFKESHPRLKNIHIFNLAGYEVATAPSQKGIYTFGGFSDASFRLMSQLEMLGWSGWPF